VVEFLERFDDQVIEREPDGSAPIGVAAEEAACRFAGLIADAVVGALPGELVGMLLVRAGKAANAEGGKEFPLVEHAAEDAAKFVWIDDGEQTALAFAGNRHGSDVRGEVRAVVDEPLHAAFETGELIDGA